MEIQEELNQEIERRIQVIEQSRPSSKESFGRRDFLFWGAVLLICLAVMLWGAGV